MIKMGKILKKMMSILSGMMLLITITSCHANYYFDYENLSENIIRIELGYYDRPEARIITDFIGNSQRRHLAFDFSRLEILENLDESQHKNFFEEFSQIWLLDHMRHYNSPNGMGILMHDKNGDFIFFSSNYVGRFDKNGDFLEFLGSYGTSSFKELVERHFKYGVIQ